jgi:hypothetical protein
MTLAPEIDGSVAIRSSGAAFLQAFRQRVGEGLLAGRPHPRSNYQVVEAGPDRLRVRAADWPTAINVGLSELELWIEQPGVVRYQVRFWRWAAYVLGLGAILGLIGVVLFVSIDLRAYIAHHPASRLPGLSVEQNLTVAWMLILFWGFVWPWILIAVHKRPVRGLVARLVGEVDARVTR